MNLQSTNFYNVNFTAMKKSQFAGVDYVVVEKYKPPIEKFNTNEDLQIWANQKCSDIIHSDLGGRNRDTYFQRREELRNWESNLNYDSKTNTEKLLVLDGISKNLRSNDDTYLPPYDETVLKKSLEDIQSQIKTNHNTQFDFDYIYRKNLIDSVITQKDNESENLWIHIPSKRGNRDGYKNNVKKLQILSSPHWCTKSEHAKDFLRDCDFDIYIENHSPKLAIKSEEGYIIEIEDELNSREIPNEYKTIINNYINEQDMVLSENAKKILNPEEIL